MIKNLLLKKSIKKTFKTHRNCLPTESEFTDPKMDYHVLADAVVWEDEGLKECLPKLENAFRFVISYRTALITGHLQKNKSQDKLSKQIFELAKIYFPDWIGFHKDRCSYNPNLADRIKRIRTVSDWKINKLMNDDNEEE